MPRPVALPLLLLPLLLAPACNSDDYGWFFISRPSKGGLYAGVVKKDSSSPSTLGVVDSGGQTVGFEVRDGDGVVRWYAALADAVLVDGPDGMLLRHVALPDGERRLPQAARLTLAPDPATLFLIDLGAAGRLHVHARGNLVVEEGPAGLVVHGAGATSFPAGSRVGSRGLGFEVVDPAGGRHTLNPPPPPAPEDCMVFVPGREAIQLLDPQGRVQAELPAAALELRPEGEGLLLAGRFPHGLRGVSDRPFTLLVPRANRYPLLLLER
ncbi:MAG: hypothetical protein R3F30_09115 [Planctomycetota bacterium]